MSVGLRGRVGSLLSFGSVPGTPAEVRDYLQRRIRMYVALVFILWSGTWVLNTVLFFTVAGFDAETLFRDYAVGAHLLGAVCMGIVWAVLRRGVFPLGALNVIDRAVTMLQAVLLAYLAACSEARFRPELGTMLGLAHVLVARAAIVPSTVQRTTLIGVLTSLPMLVATWYLHTGPNKAFHDVAPELFVCIVGIWAVVAVVVTVALSHIIFGLQRQVQQVQHLGQYTLERKIGEGGMGVVYRARHALLRRPTAIKLLRPDRAGEVAIARFEREVQLTSRLTHPNTIAIHDYGRTPDGVFYYAMEYLDGVDLETLVRLDGPQPDTRVAKVLGQVAGALAEAHEAGLIHRDVKPSNILLCERGLEPDFAKVLDFGLVREIGAQDAALSNANVVAGTPLYISPEQIRAPEQVGPRSDIYSLGAVGYYMLTGMPVFSGATVVEVCAHHLHSPVIPPSVRADRHVSPALEALILRCLEKDALKRPESAAALQAELLACENEAWTKDDARAWWKEKGPRMRLHEADKDTTSGVTRTLHVDFATRQSSASTSTASTSSDDVRGKGRGAPSVDRGPGG